MNIYFFFLKTQAMNILSEPIVNYVILWENRDLQFIKKNRFSICPESCSSSLHVVYLPTAYNLLKKKFNFIKYKLISNWTYIFCIFQFFIFPYIFYHFGSWKKKVNNISSPLRELSLVG